MSVIGFRPPDEELYRHKNLASLLGRSAGNVLITRGGEQQWPGKSSNLI
jgi:hypothetical protein